MLLRRRLMCLKSKTNQGQHYDEDGNAYDAEGLGLNLSVALTNDVDDKDTDALGLNISVALEAV